MTHFDFYFDPVCPFAWSTSRWLIDQASGHGDSISWHVMSLAILNENREPDSDAKRSMFVKSRQLGRLFMAAEASGSPSVTGSLYSALGQRLHHDREEFTVSIVGAVLADLDLPAELTNAMGDASFDAALRVAHEHSQDALGEVGGSPITGVDGEYFFGPVFSAIPTGNESDALYRAVIGLAQASTFLQLKRPASKR